MEDRRYIRKPDRAATADQRAVIGCRLRQLRGTLYASLRRGDGGNVPGLSEICGRFGIPLKTWLTYEAGTAAIPAEVVLAVILETGVSPRWLLSGSGEMFGGPVAAAVRGGLDPLAVPCRGSVPT